MDTLSDEIKIFNPEIKGLDHLRIYRSDRLVAGWDRVTPVSLNQKSITKTIIALATLMLVEKSDLNLSDHMDQLLKRTDLCDRQTAALWTDVSLYNCLTMSAGQESFQLMENYRRHNPQADWLDHALRLPFIDPPGKTVNYTNSYPYIVGLICERIIQQRAYAENLPDFLNKYLFTPLNIASPEYLTDPQGRLFGSSGIMLTTDDIGKIGLLLAAGGHWGQQTVLSPASVDLMVTPQLPAPAAENPTRTYGLFTWCYNNSDFCLAGIYGQLVYYIAEADVLFACNGHLKDDRHLPKLLRTKVLDYLKEF